MSAEHSGGARPYSVLDLLLAGCSYAGTAVIAGRSIWSVVEIALAMPEALPIRFAELHHLATAEAARRPAVLERFARRLGLQSIAPLLIVEVGVLPIWSDAIVVPMRDSVGSVIGLRVRTARRKLAVPTSQAGVFATWPIIVDGAFGPLLICEGDSDLLAGLDLGLAAIGRPNAHAGDDVVVDIVRGIDRDIVVLADRDESGVGLASAERLADRIRADLDLDSDVRVTLPPEPFGDLREWIVGADRKDMLALVSGPRRARIRSRLVGWPE